MFKLLVGALLLSAPAFAQITPKAAKSGMATSTTSPAGGRMAAKNSTKPLPQPSVKERNESEDNAIPSYRMEKDAGVHKGRNRFSAPRTKSGARKDTMKKP